MAVVVVIINRHGLRIEACHRNQLYKLYNIMLGATGKWLWVISSIMLSETVIPLRN